HPRQYNDQNAIRDHLHGASYHILSILAPYLRGKPRRAFDLLAVSRSNDPPIGAPGTPSNNTPAQ
ncbi:hypothetical protein NMT55_25090, partial [Escherichia coli]|nr:hypothetical protein [Escherichia coli]